MEGSLAQTAWVVVIFVVFFVVGWVAGEAARRKKG
jgi:hypothetical protein